MTDAHLRHELEFVRGELRGAVSLVADQEQKLDTARHEATRLRDELKAAQVQVVELRRDLAQARVTLLRGAIPPATEKALEILRKGGQL